MEADCAVGKGGKDHDMRKLIAALVVVFLLLSVPVSAAIKPGDRLHLGNTGRGSVGYFIECCGETYMITAAHLAPGWKDDIEPTGEWFVGGQPIGTFDRWIPYSGANAKDVMAIRVYPGVEVTNEIDGIQPLVIRAPHEGMPLVKVGAASGTHYGAAYTPPESGERFNASTKGLPGDSGGALHSTDIPAVVGITRSGAGSALTFAVRADWAVKELGFKEAVVTGGLPLNNLAIGDIRIGLDYLRHNRAEARDKINAALQDASYVIITLPHKTVVVPK